MAGEGLREGYPKGSAANGGLSARALNRALLARQLLLERATLAIPEALERIGGLQAQYAPSAYVGLWSRVAEFERGSLTRALVERTAIEASLMRSTIHVVSAADFPYLSAGTLDARREWWQRTWQPRIADVDVDAVVERLRSLLAGGPRRERELRKTLEETHPRLAWTAANQHLQLVRVPPSGTWERPRADLYALAESWIATRTVTVEDGRERLLARYLGGFGPAPLADAANWAGVPAASLAPVAGRLDLRRLRDEAGRELLDLPDAPLPDPETPAPVRFLPTWDATLLAHARRTQILPERFRPLVFSTRTPHSVPTFLVDGAVAGTWRYDEGRVTMRPFEPLPDTVGAELEAEAASLVRLYEASEE